MKKFITMMLALALVLTAFTGINTEAKAADVELTFFDIASSTERMTYFQKVFDAYEEQTGVKFTYEGEPWTNSMGTVLTMMAANNGPDAFVCIPGQTVFVKNGWLMEIDDYVAEHKDEYLDMITNYTWQLEKDTYGHNYLFQDGLLCRGVYYRKDWVEEIGFEIPTGKDWTWDVFWDLAEKLTDPEKNRYGFAFRGGAGADAWANNYLYAYTGSYEYDPETLKWMSEGYRNGLKAYTDSYLNGISPEDSLNWAWAEQIDAFASGLVGLFYNDSDAFPFFVDRMEEGTWGVLPIPYTNDKSGYVATINCTYSYAINAATENPEACLGLMEYLHTPEQNAEYCLMMGEIPVKKAAAEIEYFSEEGPLGAFVAQLNNMDAFLGGQLNGVNKTDEAGYVYNFVADMQSYLLGDITFDDFFGAWEQWNQDALDNYFAKNPDAVTDIYRMSDVLGK